MNYKFEQRHMSRMNQRLVSRLFVAGYANNLDLGLHLKVVASSACKDKRFRFLFRPSS